PHFDGAALARAQGGADAGQGFLEVFVNVVAECLERRDINHARLVSEPSGQSLAKQLVQRGEKGRQRLARTGRRGDQRVFARLNRGPTALLRFGRGSELSPEPPCDS